MLYLAILFFVATVLTGFRYLTVDMYLADQAHAHFMWALGLFLFTLVIGLVRRR